MSTESIAHPYLSKFDTVEKLEQYLFLAGYTKKTEDFTPNAEGFLDDNNVALAGEFTIRQFPFDPDSKDFAVGAVAFHPRIEKCPNLSDDCGVHARFDSSGVIRRWLTYERCAGTAELIDPDAWCINKLPELIVKRYANGFPEEYEHDPTEESKRLWEKGELERLSIYGSSEYLIELMGRLAEEKVEGMHSMELLKKCKGSNEEVIY